MARYQATTREEMGLLTTQEAADLLDITIYGIHKLLQRAQIKGHKIGGQRGIWLIPRSEIERYDEERRKPGRPTKDKSNELDN